MKERPVQLVQTPALLFCCMGWPLSTTECLRVWDLQNSLQRHLNYVSRELKLASTIKISTERQKNTQKKTKIHRSTNNANSIVSHLNCYEQVDEISKQPKTATRVAKQDVYAELENFCIVNVSFFYQKKVVQFQSRTYGQLAPVFVEMHFNWNQQFHPLISSEFYSLYSVAKAKIWKHDLWQLSFPGHWFIRYKDLVGI